jgi:RimJ/RimL family protein N-acetyltransferase
MMVSMASTLDDLIWPLNTKRLTLRRALESDLEETWRYRQLGPVTEWMSSAPADLEEYRVKFDDPERLAKTLLIGLDGTIIGDLMVAVGDGWAQAEVAEQAKGVQAELGWCLDPGYSGQGYATEAVTALVDLCFGALGLRRVTANCFADNLASWRLMERIGMRREVYAVRESLHRSGEWLDGMSYAMLAEEWPGSSGPAPS